MKITILTLFPQMFEGFLNESILKRAQEKKLVTIQIVNLRDFAVDSYGTVDDRPYGGGAGMVIRVDVIQKALEVAKSQNSGVRRKTILTSARGNVFNQKKALEFSQLDQLTLIAGHYEGVDERVTEYVDEELSIGDFVMTGGEIACASVVDAVVRLIPGVLKKQEATQIESFSLVEGETLLEFPQYTRPEEYEGKKVPEILLSGDHKKIDKWRLEQAKKLTQKRRPDLFDSNK